MRVAIYTRLSDDQQGTSTGIDRQRESCLQMAASRGWTVVEQYSDSDLSAFRRGIVRPGFERMLDDAGAGKFDVVLVWKLDRLVRRIAEFGRVWSTLDSASVSLASVKDSFDTSTTVGLIVVHVLVGVAQMESENISIRQRAKHAELRRLGKRSGGGTRAFGMNDDWTALVPEEAQLIRDACRRIINGNSLRSIATEWRAAGVVGPSGKPMALSTIRRLLLAERMVGRREDGGSGGFPAILSDDEHRRVSAALRDPSRRAQESTARKHLLSGMLFCGPCGTRMYPHPDKRRKNGLSYVCTKTNGGCGKTSVVGKPLEEMVAEGVLSVIDTPQLAQQVQMMANVGTDSHALDLQADEQALADLSRSRFVDRSLTEGEFRAAREPLIKRIEAHKTAIERQNTHGVLTLAIGQAREAWRSGDLLWRRSLLSAVLEKVMIHPPTTRPAFDPSRVEPIFRV